MFGQFSMECFNNFGNNILQRCLGILDARGDLLNLSLTMESMDNCRKDGTASAIFVRKPGISFISSYSANFLVSFCSSTIRAASASELTEIPPSVVVVVLVFAAMDDDSNFMASSITSLSTLAPRRFAISLYTRGISLLDVCHTFYNFSLIITSSRRG